MKSGGDGPAQQRAIVSALLPAMVYAVLAGIYILTSDRVVAAMVEDPESQLWVQTLKGWCFIVATAAMFAFVTYRMLMRVEQDRQQLDGVLEATSAAVISQDMSRCFAELDRLREEEGVDDLRTYLLAEPQRLRQCLALIQVERLNGPALELMEIDQPQSMVTASDRLFPCENDASICDFMLALYEGHDRVGGQMRMRRLDGSQRILFTTVRPVAGREGRVLVTLVDVSEIREAQEARAVAEERFREAMAVSNHILYRFDLVAWRFDYLSDHFGRCTGWTREALRSGHFIDPDGLVHDADRTEVRAALNQVQKNPTDHPTVTLEYRLRCTDGSYHWFADHATVVSDDGGQAIALVGSAADQETLKKTEEQLRHAAKMQAVGELAGGIAHDFNNVLAAIMGSAELLATRPGLAEDDRRSVERMVQTCERGSSLTQKLLAFSRRDAPRANETIDMHSLVADVADLLQRTSEPDCRVEVELPGQAFHVLADPGNIQNALLNLGLNGRDAIQAEGTVSFRLESFDPEDIEPAMRWVLPPPRGDAVQVKVVDNGCGMDTQLQERIIEPFFTTKTGGRGTGLGLSLVHRSIEEVGGGLGLMSAPECGTTFSMVLPLAHRTHAGDPTPTAAHASIGGGSVLVVDDEEMVREVTVALLRDAGYRTAECGSGEEAIDWMEEHGPPDAMICDLIMPGMDGVATVLAARERWSSLPVLVASGYADDERLRPVAQLPGLSIIQKPFRFEELLAQVRAKVLANA